MKRYITKMFSFLVCCCVLVVAAQAVYMPQTEVVPVSETRIDYEDGSYAIVKISTESSAPLTRATSTETGYKDFTYYNSSDVAIFGVRVTGTFSYTGTTSWSTSSTATVYIYDKSATYISKSASYASNYATATGNVKYNYVTIPRTVTLYCDKNGNLS